MTNENSSAEEILHTADASEPTLDVQSQSPVLTEDIPFAAPTIVDEEAPQPRDIYEEYESEIVDIVEPEHPLPDARLEDLDPLIQDALRANGWSKLMPVQSKTIPYMMSGRDMLIQSKTGSGKTGAFLIPLISILVSEYAHPQALILVPTRELAVQVKEEFDKLSVGRNVRAVAIYGGVKYEPQIAALKKGAHLVVATPGRLLDLLEQKVLDFESLRDLVMDEADEMLSLGFYPDMKALQRHLPENYCTTLFSATIPAKVQSLSREFQVPSRGFLSLSSKKMSTDALEHIYHVVEAMDKDRSILRLLEYHNPESAIVFCNMKRDVEYLTQFLRQNGWDVGELSGDVSQSQRSKTVKAFREQSIKVLIATDVAARGIDISHVTHVLLHDHPDDNDVYLHRAGRTARAGKTGKAISVVSSVEEINLKRTQSMHQIAFRKEDLPTEEQVRKALSTRLFIYLEHLLHDMKPVQRRRVDQYLPLASELMTGAARPELLAMLVEEYVRKHAGRF